MDGRGFFLLSPDRASRWDSIFYSFYKFNLGEIICKLGTIYQYKKYPLK